MNEILVFPALREFSLCEQETRYTVNVDNCVTCMLRHWGETHSPLLRGGAECHFGRDLKVTEGGRRSPGKEKAECGQAADTAEPGSQRLC